MERLGHWQTREDGELHRGPVFHSELKELTETKKKKTTNVDPK
jgi:hypothetical protein